MSEKTERMLKKVLSWILNGKYLVDSLTVKGCQVIFSPTRYMELRIEEAGPLHFAVIYKFNEIEKAVWKALPKSLVEDELKRREIKLVGKVDDGFYVSPKNIFLGNLLSVSKEVYKKIQRLARAFTKDMVEEKIHAWLIKKELRDNS